MLLRTMSGTQKWYCGCWVGIENKFGRQPAIFFTFENVYWYIAIETVRWETDLYGFSVVLHVFGWWASCVLAASGILVYDHTFFHFPGQMIDGEDIEKCFARARRLIKAHANLLENASGIIVAVLLPHY